MADYWRSEYVSNQLSLILLRFALVLCNMSILPVWEKIFWYHFWLQRSIYSSLCGKIYQCMKETFYGLTEILKLWILLEIWLKISKFFKDWSYHCKANKFEPLIIPGITFCCLYLSFLFFCLTWIWRYPVWLNYRVLKSQHCCCIWKSYIENFIMHIWKAKSVITNNLQDSWM